MHFDLSEAAAVAWAGNLARFDLYGSIHKALRLRMSELLVATARLNCTDDSELSTLCNELARLLDFCISHLEHENAFIHLALSACFVLEPGRTVDEWKLRVEGLDNHWLDGLVGAAIAASMQGAVLFGTDARVPNRPRIRLSAIRGDRR